MTRPAWLLIFGSVGLAALGIAYWLTYEPAPAVQIRWRDGLSAARRAQLERKYLLVEPDPESGHYALLDTSRRNIEALVTDPDVADTNDIDRVEFLIPFHVAYHTRWMWGAHRVPVLRVGWVRLALITLLAGMAAAGLAGLWHAARLRHPAHTS
jgi:hypothetical protein